VFSFFFILFSKRTTHMTRQDHFDITVHSTQQWLMPPFGVVLDLPSIKQSDISNISHKTENHVTRDNPICKRGAMELASVWMQLATEVTRTHVFVWGCGG
jgi:hypothetical protein